MDSNSIKWAVVFAVFIFSYMVAFKLYKRLSSRLDKVQERDKAIERGHVIKAKLVKSWVEHDDDNECWSHATYEYTVNGKTKNYRTYFKGRNTQHRVLNLYYLDNPKKVFSTDDYQVGNRKGLLRLFIIAIPWGLAALCIYLLQISVI